MIEVQSELTENLTFHARSKRVHIRHLFIKDMLRDKLVLFIAWRNRKLGDILTKELPKPMVLKLCKINCSVSGKNDMCNPLNKGKGCR